MVARNVICYPPNYGLYYWQRLNYYIHQRVDGWMDKYIDRKIDNMKLHIGTKNPCWVWLSCIILIGLLLDMYPLPLRLTCPCPFCSVILGLLYTAVYLPFPVILRTPRVSSPLLAIFVFLWREEAAFGCSPTHRVEGHVSQFVTPDFRCQSSFDISPGAFH